MEIVFILCALALIRIFSPMAILVQELTSEGGTLFEKVCLAVFLIPRLMVLGIGLQCLPKLLLSQPFTTNEWSVVILGAIGIIWFLVVQKTSILDKLEAKRIAQTCEHEW